MSELGFIILRHVNSELTNQYWINCVMSIRKFYPENNIVIIDDNSNYNFINKEYLYKTIVINSEYPKRGELLPYYYYLRNKWFNNAVIIHDSTIINDPIFTLVNSYTFIWEFEHNWDQVDDELRIIECFDDLELKNFYKNKHLWKGCFGAMTIINHDYLKYVNSKYDISKMLDLILNRYNRCSFERVIACILQKEGRKETLLGNIHKYCPFGISFCEKDNYKNLPIIKYWSGR